MPEAYNELPEEYKQVLADCCKENRAYTFDHLTEAAAEAREVILSGGVECITLSDEDFNTIKAIAAETLQNYWGQSELTDEFLTLYTQFLERQRILRCRSQNSKITLPPKPSWVA